MRKERETLAGRGFAVHGEVAERLNAAVLKSLTCSVPYLPSKSTLVQKAFIHRTFWLPRERAWTPVNEGGWHQKGTRSPFAAKIRCDLLGDSLRGHLDHGGHSSSEARHEKWPRCL